MVATTEGPRRVSPNEIMEAAKRLQLDGRDPETRQDWVDIAAFVILNTGGPERATGTQVVLMLFDCPPEIVSFVPKIAEFFEKRGR